jgi:uncharacterized membrane protein YbhN (UPF0104 family)
VRSGWIRLAQAVVGLSIVLFAGRSLVRNWEQLRSQPLEWQLRPGWLVLSLVLTWAMYLLLIVAWRSILISWGQQLGLGSAARIWIVSSLGKYIPGKVWAVAGMALLSQRAGVAASAATGSAIIMQVLAIGTGAAVAGVAGAHTLDSTDPNIKTGLWLLVAGSMLAVGLLLWPPLLRRLLRLLTPLTSVARQPTDRSLLLGIATNIIAWLGYGLALWLLARGLLPRSGLDLRLAVAAFTASYLAGFLALLAPGGLGVREGIFILMLQGPLGLAAATSLAVASRLFLTVAELGAAVPFLAFHWKQARVPS